MYCPKCSQQQASEQQRFCSRCGFPLGAVTDLVKADGVLQVPEKEKGAGRRSPRYEGVRQGVILLMLAVVFLPLVDVIVSPYHEALVFTLLLAGVMRATYALIFQEGTPKRHADASALRDPRYTTTELSEGERPAALPPAGTIPAADLTGRRKEPAETVEPPSVTDNTTKLLADK